MSGAAQTPFDAWRWLAPNSGADHCVLRAGERALVLFLDPVSLVVAMPPLPGDEPALARFCRVLGQAARELAATDLGPDRPSPLATSHDNNGSRRESGS